MGLCDTGAIAMRSFTERASTFLGDWSQSDAIAAIRGRQGHWHPTGFAVFQLGETFEAMPVRVHCWLKSERPVEHLHPPLHTHVWPLAGKVMMGKYVETIYDLTPTSDGGLRLYSVDYHSRDDASVAETGSSVAAASSAQRSYEAGEIHTVQEGVWHETQIPTGAIVVTVMVTGRAVLDRPWLAGPPGYVGGRSVRAPVDADRVLAEVLEACAP